MSAVKLCSHLQEPPLVICDFGAGNGECCKLLADCYPRAKLICYEPTPYLLLEARKNLNAVPNVEFCQDILSYANEMVDLVLCLEVFEHLPYEETADTLSRIATLIKPEGLVVIGVPVEVGIPAIYKGIFRMLRRYGAFDANVKNVTLASLGYPPGSRPISEITPGFRFHYEHMGFDFRSFKKTLGNYFRINEVSASPCTALGIWLMPEIYFVMKSFSNQTDTRV